MRFVKYGAVAALSAISISAQAADLPVKRTAVPPPVYTLVKTANWTGGYVGLIGGYGWADASINTADFGNTGSVTVSPSGWLIGLECPP